MRQSVTGTSGSARPGGERSPLSSLLTRVRQENEELLETLQHLLVLQGKSVKFRKILVPDEAYAYLQELLEDYFDLEHLRVVLFDECGMTPETVYSSFSSAPRSDTDTSDDGDTKPERSEALPSTELGSSPFAPFTPDEANQALDTAVSILRDLQRDKSETTGCPTSILAPIHLRGEQFGVVVLDLRQPVTRLHGLRLRVVDYLVKELAVFINRHQLDHSVHYMAALNRGIIESVGHGLIAVDRQGMVLCFNPAARIYLRDEQPGRHFERVICKDLAPTTGQMLEKLESGAGHEALSVEFTASDGQVFPLSISSAPLQVEDENEAGWVFVIKDLTHRVEVEHLKQYEALKSDFLLGLIHDMKTPLTGIVSGCEIMMEEPGLDHDQIDTLKIIHASAGRLQELATDSLEMSALESAATDDPMEPTNLGATLSAVLDELRPTASRHDILFQAPEEPLVLYCQPRRIARVLQNLVTNAVKYSPSGGSIQVRVERCDNSARISVSDEGIGIKKNELPSIWERFHRSSSGGVKHIEGTGLGLSIIKMIVDKHRGQVHVDSEPGKGSTFAISLPILSAPQTVEIP